MKIIILAGGQGSRLWPLSQMTCPKQFLRFGQPHSLLQKTILRFLAAYPAEDIFLSTTQEHRNRVEEEATALDKAFSKQILEEPEPKNTGPATALCIQTLIKQDRLHPGECFLVCPSDHLMSPESFFLNLLPKAEHLAKKGALVLFGIRPHKPETGYGYIKTRSTTDPEVFCVDRFVEKPAYAAALQYLLEGDVFWNAGILLAERDHFIQEMALHAPDISAIFSSAQNTLETFSAMPSIPLDIALLEKSATCKVLPLDLLWSDVGSWDSVYEILEKDEAHNATLGNVLAMDTKRCLIIGGKRLISTIGLEELLIIETEEALFIGKKGESQKVRELVERLEHERGGIKKFNKG